MNTEHSSDPAARKEGKTSHINQRIHPDLKDMFMEAVRKDNRSQGNGLETALIDYIEKITGKRWEKG